jgi:2-keto-4-pentenoate hydratase/2-oxohepta-3-ene-1,7-dioic acid hydratase in catechol pathway
VSQPTSALRTVVACIGDRQVEQRTERTLTMADALADEHLVGPDDDVRPPRRATKTDWEVELGIVIGSRASYLADEVEARAAIAGYVLVNSPST